MLGMQVCDLVCVYLHSFLDGTDIWPLIAAAVQMPKGRKHVSERKADLMDLKRKRSEEGEGTDISWS